MKQYRIVDDRQISDMMSKIKEIVDACHSFLNLLQHAKGSLTIEAPTESVEVKEEVKVRVSRRKKPKIADVIYEYIVSETFTTKEAYHAIKDKMELHPTRPLDAIREALRRDSRFEKIATGKYRKLHKPKRESEFNFENK